MNVEVTATACTNIDITFDLTYICIISDWFWYWDIEHWFEIFVLHVP